MFLLCMGITVIAVVHFWSGSIVDKVLIRAGGEVVMSLPLRLNRVVQVPGPLGITEIEIVNKKVRIKKDPSPRQYCVQQGWLDKAGQVAICLPNQISIELLAPNSPYDTLSF